MTRKDKLQKSSEHQSKQKLDEPKFSKNWSTPERKRAWKKFKYFYDICMPDNITHKKFDRDYAFEENFSGFSSVRIPIRKLPHPIGWVWNQSNGAVTLKISDERYVNFKKLSPRKKTTESGNPNGKLWYYSIYDIEDNKLLGTIIWCENGVSLYHNPYDDNERKIERPLFTEEEYEALSSLPDGWLMN